MIYGLIISAGKQSRFKTDIPKALSMIDGETLLDINIRHMSKACDRVIVVCSESNAEYFSNYDNIQITSGYGCGDAVMKALEKLKLSYDDYVFIQWGDSMHKSCIYSKLIDESENDKVIIPCVKETKPYVQLKESNGSIEAKFSKYGEETTEGYHDLSLFYAPALYLLDHLHRFADSIKTDNGYIHRHNNEMQFLDVFNDTEIKGKIVEIPNYKDFAFNTVDELKEKIQQFSKNS